LTTHGAALREKARQHAGRENRERLPLAPAPQTLVWLSLWLEPVRAVSNGFLRSGLSLK
jgi:hypothetical protein